MNRLLLSIIILFASFFDSCKSKNQSTNDTVDVAKSYAVIYNSFATTNKVQNSFFGKATEVLGIVRNDNEAIVDTKDLESSLDSARSACETRIAILKQADEIDDEIKYKAKALEFAYVVESLYKNEFPELIVILRSKSPNRFQESQNLLLGKMQEMHNVMWDCHNAGEAIRKKYHIKNERNENQ